MIYTRWFKLNISTGREWAEPRRKTVKIALRYSPTRGGDRLRIFIERGTIYPRRAGFRVFLTWVAELDKMDIEFTPTENRRKSAPVANRAVIPNKRGEI